MADPYVGEVRMFGASFAPVGWLMCDGSELPISEYDTLFSLIGTTYGGDGQQTFRVPDLRGRFPMHNSATRGTGWMGGVESVTLTSSQLAGHTHQLYGSVNQATDTSPQDHVPASLPVAGTTAGYNTRAPFGALDPTSIGPAGNSQPHNNLHPYLAITFMIATEGIYPSQ